MNPFAYDGIALSAPLQLTGCLYGFTCTSKNFHLAAAFSRKTIFFNSFSPMFAASSV